MDKYLKYFLIFLLILTITSITYLIIKIIILYLKAKKAVNSAFYNSKYCGKKTCDPTDEQLVQKFPDNININLWQLDVAKYCSIAVYIIEQAGLKNVKPNYPYDLVVIKEIYDNKNDPVFGAIFTDKSSASNVWIVFRGTQSQSELQQDFSMQQESLFKPYTESVKQVKMSFLQSSTGTIAKVHEGFVDVYMNFRNDIFSTLKTLDPEKKKTIIVTGHSLGAAIATLVGVDLAQSGYKNVVVYSFASPRVGDTTFKTIVDDLKLPLYRIVNISDIAPEMPLAVTPNFDDPDNPFIYSHCGTIVPFQINRLSILNNHLMPTYMEALSNMIAHVYKYTKT